MTTAMTAAQSEQPDAALIFRPIRSEDDAQIGHIIRSVFAELGFEGPGYSSNDAEVAAMTETYATPGYMYYVVAEGSRVLGGGGIGPLAGGPADTCELRKMYLLPEARGRGAGRTLLQLCLTAARRLGYRRCYLETFTSMERARALYTRSGFTRLAGPLGATGHSAPDAFYIATL